MNILIADDEEAQVELMREFLTRRGHTVHTASDGRRALELLKENSYRLAFLDLSMPEVTGFEIVDFIRKSSLNVKVVMITAYPYPLMGEFVSQAEGVDEFLSKPFSFEDLEKIVKKYQ